MDCEQVCKEIGDFVVEAVPEILDLKPSDKVLEIGTVESIHDGSFVSGPPVLPSCPLLP